MRLKPDSGRPGDLIRIQGASLRSVSSVWLNGISLAFQGTADTVLSFRIPSNAVTGRVVLRSATFCSDSALLRVIRNCRAPISYTLTGLAACGTNAVTVKVDSTSGTGCFMQWYLASSGTASAPMSTDSIFRINLTATDTILVRRFCSPACISPFVKLPVQVTNSLFEIGLDPPSARNGDLITIKGASLSKVGAVVLNGQPLFFDPISDTTILFRIPAGAVSGTLLVVDTTGRICPDSALLSIRPPSSDTCRIAPTLGTRAILVCPGRTITIRFANTSGCELQWFLASAGISRGPLGVGDQFDLNVNRDDTLMLRRMCDSACISAFDKTPVHVNTSPFGISADPASGMAGDTIVARGNSLQNVTTLMLDVWILPIIRRTDTSMTFVIPRGTAVGPLHLRAISAGFCNDSTIVEVLLPSKAQAGLAQASLSVKPNPAHASFTASLSGPVSGSVLVELIDLSGRVLSTKTASSRFDAIPVSLKAIPAGLYHLRVHTAGQVLVQKVVVE
jgi:hypothetical protein